MSEDERSDTDAGSSSDGDEDLQTTGLIATRAKRATAGNIYYSSLRANLDDEQVQADLLAEDEDDDAGDYEGSDKDDEDEALESSSDEEDSGPPKEGQEDLEGERVLKKDERLEARKKRKAQDARLKLPAWQKKNKKVKLAEDAKADDAVAEKPKKKSERANWLPTLADAPQRQSGRALAVANRETTHANLQQSYERSERQRKVMQDAEKRLQLKKRREMSQEERMEMCHKIAKQTDKEFGRWEREEAERQKLRDEQLAAKRQKGVDGPFFRHWSGSVLWEGEKIKVRRMSHGSKKGTDVSDQRSKNVESLDDGMNVDDGVQATGSSGPATSHTAKPSQAPVPATKLLADDQVVPVANAGPSTAAVGSSATPSDPAPTLSTAQPPVPWLHGIHDYASQPVSQQQAAYAPQLTAYSVPASAAPIATAPPTTNQAVPTANGLTPSYPTPHASVTQQQSPVHIYQTWPPGSQHFSVSLPPAPPPAPPIREQAQRCLVMLEEFEGLETAAKRPKTASILEPTAPASTLLPDSYPTFNADETRYLTKGYLKKSGIPPGPTKPNCAILSHKGAKFRDPKTGLPYFDMHMYKIIQRVIAGGSQWSSLLGAWVGPRSDGVMGRPAKGVPEGFAGPQKLMRRESAQVKAEQGAA
ncbi:hypothetical protein B0A50_03148 [Salinomyces thailandicus]|uniref:Vps72/YL1 C-terminal domain-containing protein n=1 Tax=Salinomyces thailandicus TaxID=706561 RepID=A0A4U0U4K0_9PEZI|nr:hypothetical protein B0A50_03148 [Salinomyces thailandica]